jgi:hypothetical protein
MSEAVADFPQPSGYKNLETRALAGLINNWFDQVASDIAPDDYKHLPAGAVAEYVFAGMGKVSLRYLGSRYLPRDCNEPHRPLQQCDYVLSIEADRGQSAERASGWWMPAHMVEGPTLMLDERVTAEDFVGTTIEERMKLEQTIGRLQAAFLGRNMVAELKP